MASPGVSVAMRSDVCPCTCTAAPADCIGFTEELRTTPRASRISTRSATLPIP
jgi:hypothetical protein